MSLTRVSYSMINGAVVNVLDYGADPTGVADSSTAIQAALTYAGTITSGKVNYAAVYLPNGIYLASNLEIPLGVTLFGDGVTTCQIKVTDTVNNCIKMQNYTAVQGILFKYTNQTTTIAPTVYPATIVSSATTPGSYSVIRDVRVQGAYDFINLVGCTHFTIQNVDGMPYRYGIVMDTFLDSVTIENVHFNYSYMAFGGTLISWIKSNAIGITFKRVDSAKVTDYLCFGMQNAVKFEGGLPSGAANGIYIENFVFDLVAVPINIVNFQDGIYFSNGWVTSFDGNPALSNGPCQIGPDGFSYDPKQFVCFSNVKFNAFNNNVLNVACNTSFSNCDFYNYNQADTSDATGSAVVIKTGDIFVQFANCYFNGAARTYSNAVYEDGTYTGYKVQVANTDIQSMGSGKASFNLAEGRFSVASTELAKFIWNGVTGLAKFNSLYLSTVPAAGTWAVADRFFNSIPTAGQPKSWVCTVAGTPGTWVSEGNL